MYAARVRPYSRVVPAYSIKHVVLRSSMVAAWTVDAANTRFGSINNDSNNNNTVSTNLYSRRARITSLHSQWRVSGCGLRQSLRYTRGSSIIIIIIVNINPISTNSFLKGNKAVCFIKKCNFSLRNRTQMKTTYTILIIISTFTHDHSTSPPFVFVYV